MTSRSSCGNFCKARQTFPVTAFAKHYSVTSLLEPVK
jgi:hypothetical protein